MGKGKGKSKGKGTVWDIKFPWTQTHPFSTGNWGPRVCIVLATSNYSQKLSYFKFGAVPRILGDAGVIFSSFATSTYRGNSALEPGSVPP
jgi:hypothetical protein